MRFTQDVNLTVATPTGATWIAKYTNNPSQSIDFASMANLFDEYRVCAMKVYYIPSMTANANVGQGFMACFVMHDPNSTTEPVTALNNCVSYENCTAFNLQRPWKYYRKMARNIPSNSSWTAQRNIGVSGYLPTDSPLDTQGTFI